MPIARYDVYFGGKAGSAQEAHDAMVKEYGQAKGESVFYASVRKRAGAHLAGAMNRAARKVRGHHPRRHRHH